MGTTPPGWYDDGQGFLRWWDGGQWTEHVHGPVPAASAPESAPTPADAPAEVVPAETPTSEAAPVEPAPAQASTESAEATAPPAAPVATETPTAYPATAVPPAYPGAATPASPGTATAVGGGEPPKKSRTWILWVIIAAIVVFFVAVAAILIPIVIGMLDGTRASDPDEAQAVAAVELYDDAWDTADCGAFENSTTQGFRDVLGFSDCASFEEQARFFGETTDDYEIEVVDIQKLEDGSIEVSTLETYTSTIDETGQELAEPEPFADRYLYVVVYTDGAWLIDDALNG